MVFAIANNPIVPIKILSSFDVVSVVFAKAVEAVAKALKTANENLETLRYPICVCNFSIHVLNNFVSPSIGLAVLLVLLLFSCIFIIL